MPESTIAHYDIDYVTRLYERFHASEPSSEEYVGLAIAIAEQVATEQWLPELRCLRERVLSPCPDPNGHTHAPC